MYSKDELVKIAKRDNNTKRQYLLVNPLQGKHIPVSPNQSVKLFSKLAHMVRNYFYGEKILLIGFAETATAIGASIACECEEVLYYIHTTREMAAGVKNYIYFSEVHSHAAEQKLAADHLPEMLDQADRIVFAEDEVTTGNTILNLIKQLKEHYTKCASMKFGMISILNNMTGEVKDQFNRAGIPCLYLLDIKIQNMEERLNTFRYDTQLRVSWNSEYGLNENLYQNREQQGNIWEEYMITGKIDPRKGVTPKLYKRACDNLSAVCISHLLEIHKVNLKGKKVLVLGTEEFMFPGLYLGKQLEDNYGCQYVRYHASTRSPILPSGEDEYPIHTRNELRSVYDGERITYIYNLDSYDLVIWLCDAPKVSKEGIRSMKSALMQADNKNIFFYKWSD